MFFVPNLKAIASALSDDEVNTKKTDSATSKDTSVYKLDTKTTDNEVKIKTAKDGALFSEASKKVKTKTTSTRCESTLHPATLRQNIHHCLLWPKLMLPNCISNVPLSIGSS